MIIVFLLAALQAFFLVSLLLAKRTKSMADNVLLAGLREEAELSSIPKLVQGTAMNLIIAGILSMAFMGFAGLFSST
jgi:Na+-translocating ferredoxin:NAD+ oxidoreductase RnfA subunit